MDLTRLLQVMAAQAPLPTQPAHGRAKASRLARALMGDNPKLRSALPKYGEPQHADQYGPLPGSDPYGAFQGDAFDSDAYQVEMF